MMLHPFRHPPPGQLGAGHCDQVLAFHHCFAAVVGHPLVALAAQVEGHHELLHYCCGGGGSHPGYAQRDPTQAAAAVAAAAVVVDVEIAAAGAAVGVVDVVDVVVAGDDFATVDSADVADGVVAAAAGAGVDFVDVVDGADVVADAAAVAAVAVAGFESVAAVVVGAAGDFVCCVDTDFEMLVVDVDADGGADVGSVGFRVVSTCSRCLSDVAVGGAAVAVVANIVAGVAAAAGGADTAIPPGVCTNSNSNLNSYSATRVVVVDAVAHIHGDFVGYNDGVGVGANVSVIVGTAVVARSACVVCLWGSSSSVLRHTSLVFHFLPDLLCACCVWWLSCGIVPPACVMYCFETSSSEGDWDSRRAVVEMLLHWWSPAGVHLPQMQKPQSTKVVWE